VTDASPSKLLFVFEDCAGRPLGFQLGETDSYSCSYIWSAGSFKIVQVRRRNASLEIDRSGLG